MKFKVKWQSNYNGISVLPSTMKWDELSLEERKIINKISDEADDTLPEYTYDAAKRWEGLGDEEINELKRRALKIINNYYPNVTIDELEYEEDSLST